MMPNAAVSPLCGLSLLLATLGVGTNDAPESFANCANRRASIPTNGGDAVRRCPPSGPSAT